MNEEVLVSHLLDAAALIRGPKFEAVNRSLLSDAQSALSR